MTLYELSVRASDVGLILAWGDDVSGSKTEAGWAIEVPLMGWCGFIVGIANCGRGLNLEVECCPGIGLAVLGFCEWGAED